MRHFGCALSSVSATVPESNSSEPPLRFSTRAVAVSVKTARSPLRSPASLKSCSVTVAGDGFVRAGASAAESAGSDSRLNRAKMATDLACEWITILMVVRSMLASDFGFAYSFPRKALRLADHPLQLFRARVSAVSLRHSAQVAEQSVGRDFGGIRTRHQPLGKRA